MRKITISNTIDAPILNVWEKYNLPEHIVNWNFAHESWHCPHAENDLRVGGRYLARMEAKDGSFGFDFDAVYKEVNEPFSFTYEFGGREATVQFQDLGGQTKVTVSFDPEEENSLEMQEAGWQSILDNFKRYAEMR